MGPVVAHSYNLFCTYTSPLVLSFLKMHLHGPGERLTIGVRLSFGIFKILWHATGIIPVNSAVGFINLLVMKPETMLLNFEIL